MLAVQCLLKLPVVVRPFPIWQLQTMAEWRSRYFNTDTNSSKSFSSGAHSSEVAFKQFNIIHDVKTLLRFQFLAEQLTVPVMGMR